MSNQPKSSDSENSPLEYQSNQPHLHDEFEEKQILQFVEDLDSSDINTDTPHIFSISTLDRKLQKLKKSKSKPKSF